MKPDVKYDIALSMVKGIGSVLNRRLVAAFGSPEAVFKASVRELERIQGLGETLAAQIKEDGLIARAEQEIAFLEKAGGDVVCLDDENYPKRLRECEDAPLLFYKKGKMTLESPHCIGIVGTRKMTQYGKSMISRVLEDLSQKVQDCLIVSGLAYGVDGMAHRTALDLGLQTIGVVGHGLDMIYPAAHRSLAERMLENGGLLTEFHSHCKVDRKNFVSRNRIIAGLCDVVWVVESGEKGGALLTADFADSYNRDVCATPGRVGDYYSLGCNNLIKTNKATWVDCADDIVQLMNWDKKEPKKQPIQLSLFMELSENERLVVQALEIDGKMQLNTLARKLQMSIGALSPLLFEMEMKDLLTSYPGSVYELKR